MSTDFKLTPRLDYVHACCFYGYAPDQQTQFFKDVAQNRGVRIEFFDSREAALRWLGVGSGQQI